MMWTHWFAGMMQAEASDRLYNCLPMYHSVGGVVASGAVLLKGGAVILREKFSARAFWDDVAESGATIFQYIGELCRYLLRSPGDPGTAQFAAGLRQRTVGRCVGGVPDALSHSAGSWNSMPPPKAISRSTMPKESRARSAAFHPSCGIASASP